MIEPVIVSALLGAAGGYFVRKFLDARQIRYRHLYERRAEVIAQLYKLLVEAGDALRLWGSPFGGYQEEQQRDFERRFDELHRYYRTSSLWLDNQTRRALDAFFDEARAVHLRIIDLQDFRSLEEWDELQSGSETPISRADARNMVQRKARTEIPKLVEQLREDFREIIEISDLRDRDAPRRWWQR